jgi:hypothetical protein
MKYHPCLRRDDYGRQAGRPEAPRVGGDPVEINVGQKTWNLEFETWNQKPETYCQT